MRISLLFEEFKTLSNTKESLNGITATSQNATQGRNWLSYKNTLDARPNRAAGTSVTPRPGEGSHVGADFMAPLAIKARSLYHKTSEKKRDSSLTTVHSRRTCSLSTPLLSPLRLFFIPRTKWPLKMIHRFHKRSRCAFMCRNMTSAPA